MLKKPHIGINPNCYHNLAKILAHMNICHNIEHCYQNPQMLHSLKFYNVKK